MGGAKMHSCSVEAAEMRRVITYVFISFFVSVYPVIL